MNNKTLVGLNVGLVIAVVILFIMQFSGGKSEEVVEETPVVNDQEEEAVNTGIDTAGLSFDGLPVFKESMKVAYVNGDSVMNNYQFAKDKNDEFLKEYEAAESRLQRNGKEFLQAQADLQKQYEMGMITSQEEMDRELGKLAQQEEALGQLQYDLQQKMANKTATINNEILDYTEAFFKKLGNELGYDYVVQYTKGSIFMYVNPKYDITNYVIEKLNEDYNKNNGTTEEVSE